MFSKKWFLSLLIGAIVAIIILWIGLSIGAFYMDLAFKFGGGR